MEDNERVIELEDINRAIASLTVAHWDYQPPLLIIPPAVAEAFKAQRKLDPEGVNKLIIFNEEGEPVKANVPCYGVVGIHVSRLMQWV